MSRMLQLRGIPDDLYYALDRRAGERGQSVTEYVREILEREVARPAAQEVFERIRRLPRVDIGRPAAELIREERAESERRFH